jgi:lipopolysaccharide biosynthesis regulator YciM
MRLETYRTAYDEANAEMQDIIAQFDELCLRKDQVEKVVEALKPFVGLHAETTAEVLEAAYSMTESTEQVSEPIEFTYTSIAEPSNEAVVASVAMDEEPVVVAVDATPEQVAYFRQPSSDPFQRRIDDALWGWQQRPEGLLSPI